ncbi:MAG: GGDEF domain-containing protein [Oscillospiraceae bacterium]|nr:GGDEF domain-containing protein [Oscillospiraceae bacterium]
MSSVKNETHSDKIKKTKLTMIIGYAFIIVISTILISVLTLGKTSAIMEAKVKDMTSALNVQLKININSYLSKLETTGTLIFAAPEVYEYDAVNPSVDEYEALNIEDTIGDKLMELCIMENYVDFGIVYSNNHSVGKLSNGTANLFGDELYSSLAEIISRKRTSDGWATGCRDDYKRIYYVKRVNDNAVFVASFYTTELENVFELPETMNDMTVRLADGNDHVIYSSVDDEAGSLLPSEITERIAGHTSAAVVDENYLITVDNCSDEWRVICSIPRAIILEEMNDIRSSTIVIAIAAALIAILMGIFLSIRVTNPMDTLFSDLDSKARIDRLTGVNNKRSFEEAVEKALSDPSKKGVGVLLILDVDNFKGVNDTLGHSYGDKVLSNIGVILKTTFRSSDILGRIGGDEFAVFMNIPSQDKNSCCKVINARCEALCEAFRNNYTGEDNSYKISTSIGAAISPEHGNDFASLYKCADSALYASKHKGKDTYTVYSDQIKEAGDKDDM